MPGVFNPVALVHQIEDQSPVNRILGNFTGTVSVLENLTSQTTLGADNSNAERRTFLPNASPAGSPFGGYARQVNRSAAEPDVPAAGHVLATVEREPRVRGGGWL